MPLDADQAAEIFGAFGPVRLRPMFGGCGIYAEGAMFALEVREIIYLKSDGATEAAYEAEGCEPFSYDTAQGRRTIASFRRAPERLLDDPEEMASWARRALAVALSGKSKGSDRKPRRVR